MTEWKKIFTHTKKQHPEGVKQYEKGKYPSRKLARFIHHQCPYWMLNFTEDQGNKTEKELSFTSRIATLSYKRHDTNTGQGGGKQEPT